MFDAFAYPGLWKDYNERESQNVVPNARWQHVNSGNSRR